MDKAQVEIIRPDPLEAAFDGGAGLVVALLAVPDLGSQKDVLASHV